jgi:hypothetical protein
MSKMLWWFLPHLAFVAVALTLFGLFISPVLANSPPGVVDIFVTNYSYVFEDTYNTASPYTPSVGVSKTVYVNGRVTDADGVGSGFEDGDLRYVQLLLYREVLGVSCVEDVNNCYKTYCSVRSGDVTSELEYTCAIETSHLIDPTTEGSPYENQVWHAEVIVMDRMDHLSTRIKKIEVESLLAVGSPNTLDFGVLAREEVTTVDTNVEYVLTQYGNTEATVELSGEDMTCSVNGLIPVENIKWGLEDVEFLDPSMTRLNHSEVASGAYLDADDTNVSMENLYFNIELPDVVSGSCSGSLSIKVLQVES